MKITFVLPVARTAFTRDWKPATWYWMPLQAPPSRQHFQPDVSSPVARSGYGSLNRSRTIRLSLKVLATLVQNCGAYWASGIGFWQVAFTSEQPDEVPVYRP